MRFIHKFSRKTVFHNFRFALPSEGSDFVEVAERELDLGLLMLICKKEEARNEFYGYMHSFICAFMYFLFVLEMDHLSVKLGYIIIEVQHLILCYSKFIKTLCAMHHLYYVSVCFLFLLLLSP